MTTVGKNQGFFSLYSSLYRPLWSKIEKVAIKNNAENCLCSTLTQRK